MSSECLQLEAATNAVSRGLLRHIAEQISNGTNQALSTEEVVFTRPPSIQMGDIAFPCFALAKIMRRDPRVIAQSIAEQMESSEWVQGAQADGGYVNVQYHRAAIAQKLLSHILSEKEHFGRADTHAGRRIMMEYVSPNTNKPLHLGHIRNALLGWSTAELLKMQGAQVIKSDVINDRGIHIMKSLLAYQEYGNNDTPESTKMKGDHLVGLYYVLFEILLQEEKTQWLQENGHDIDGMGDAEKKVVDTRFLQESKRMAAAYEALQKWEQGDPEIIALWKQMNKWVMDGFSQTYGLLGVDFDKHYLESEIYEDGKAMIMEALEKGVFRRAQNGAVVAPLSEVSDLFKYDKALLRADGTGLYITQDITLAVIKFREFRLTDSIYCIASEQNYYMQQVFAVMRMLEFPLADRMQHLSYGMVYLPGGKMKSREGTVVDADELIEDLQKRALETLKDRYPEVEWEELEQRARAIALAAVKFHILMVGRTTDMHFDPEKSLSFEGRTGPYVQYAYARIASLQRRGNVAESDIAVPQDASMADISDTEWNLIVRILEYPTVAYRAAVQMDPSSLAEYLFEVAQNFTAFYHEQPILNAKEPKRSLRLAIAKACQIVLKSGLNALGIETLEVM